MTVQGANQYADALNTTEAKLAGLSGKHRELFDFIHEHQGATNSEIMDHFGWGLGTVRYYRNQLVQQGLLRYDRNDYPHRLYCVSDEKKILDLRLLSHLEDRDRAKVLEHLIALRQSNKRPGGWITSNAAAKKLLVSRDFVKRTAERFEEFGLAETRVECHKHEIRATEEAHMNEVVARTLNLNTIMH